MPRSYDDYPYQDVRDFIHGLRNIVSKIDGYLDLRRNATSRGKKAFYQRKIQEKTDELISYLETLPK